MPSLLANKEQKNFTNQGIERRNPDFFVAAVIDNSGEASNASPRPQSGHRIKVAIAQSASHPVWGGVFC